MVAMNRYMLILSRRIPVIKKAQVSNVYIEKGNWSRQLNKHIAHNSVFMAQMYLKLSPIYVNRYILLMILHYVATLCFIMCILTCYGTGLLLKRSAVCC